MTGFPGALAGIAENPVARREWRGLAHELGDWRVWLYLRQPRQARGWAVRALLGCALLPYALWATLATLHPWASRNGLAPLRIDVLPLGFLLVGLYLCLASGAVMALSIARERERETWETLRTTTASAHELLLGLLFGRLTPLLAGFLIVGMVWSYARPHYAPLLRPYMVVRLSGQQIALLVWELAFVAAGAGSLSLAASAWCRKSGTANAVAAADVLLLIAGLLGAVMGLPRVEGAVILLAGSGTAILAGYLSALYSLQRDAESG